MKGQWRYLCRMHVKNGTKQTFVAVTLSFLQGSGHSSSIPYPMSLCCWDKVVFVCPWLLARAHRALKLCLNDGIFISTPPFHACSHPSLLSLCTDPHPLPTHPHPHFHLSLSNCSSGTVLHQYCACYQLGSVLGSMDRQHQFLMKEYLVDAYDLICWKQFVMSWIGL